MNISITIIMKELQTQASVETMQENISPNDVLYERNLFFIIHSSF